ncbi:helix-turn-helix transcriptional regulator [Pedobacter sp.]|uniref:helix-turn-helix transcriptional regulator n=1 Tax=Pedobacter sp. TaxID=1411316 RepID=UPI003D7F4305
MKQLDRLKHIYNALSVTPQTIESLQHSFKKLAVEISNRQLYRDIADVGAYFLKDGEILEEKSTEYNRKIWLLNRQTNAAAISNTDIDTFLIVRAIIPLAVAVGREESILKIESLMSSHLSNSKIENNANWHVNSIENTHFYEAYYGEAYQTCLNEMIWSASNRRSMEITAYDGDSVSLYKSIKFPLLFNPLKIIYHRGSFYVAGLIDSTKQCLVLDTHQIISYKLSNDTFPVKQNLLLLENNLKNRFGISQNIDDQVYMIVLEFSSTTGKYIHNLHWHHTQQFQELPDGNWQLTLTCGINRELMGWIYQWIDNVKIHQPEILKDYYLQHFNRIDDNQQGVLTYSNLTQPQ